MTNDEHQYNVEEIYEMLRLLNLKALFIVKADNFSKVQKPYK